MATPAEEHVWSGTFREPGDLATCNTTVLRDVDLQHPDTPTILKRAGPGACCTLCSQSDCQVWCAAGCQCMRCVAARPVAFKLCGGGRAASHHSFRACRSFHPDTSDCFLMSNDRGYQQVAAPGVVSGAARKPNNLALCDASILPDTFLLPQPAAGAAQADIDSRQLDGAGDCCTACSIDARCRGWCAGGEQASACRTGVALPFHAGSCGALPCPALPFPAQLIRCCLARPACRRTYFAANRSCITMGNYVEVPLPGSGLLSGTWIVDQWSK